MRRRLVRSTLLIVLATMLILGVPLGVVGARLTRREAELRLVRQTEFVAQSVERRLESGNPIGQRFLDDLTPERLQISVVDDAGGTVWTAGPEVDGPSFEASVELSNGGSVTGVTSRTRNDQRVLLIWGIVVLLAIGAFAVAAGLLARQARRLARPLEDLRDTSQRLGAGDFTARATPSGVPEIDAVGEALDHSAERLTELVAREREFSANVSHQLRTPLTAMQIRLESALDQDDPEVWREALDGSLKQLDRLTDTVEDLLAHARKARASQAELIDVRPLVKLQVQHWRPLFDRYSRFLVLEDPSEPTPARVSPGGLGQVLDVLLDNALQHGKGTVRVELSQRAEGHVMVSVSDDGPGIPYEKVGGLFEPKSKDGRGIGLPLAATLLAADGGRLELSRPRPPRFVIALPGASSNGEHGSGSALPDPA